MIVDHRCITSASYTHEVTNELTNDIAHIERAYATVGIALGLAHSGQGGYCGGHWAIRSSRHGRYTVGRVGSVYQIE